MGASRRFLGRGQLNQTTVVLRQQLSTLRAGVADTAQDIVKRSGGFL